MAEDKNALQDKNQFPALIAHTGTDGTAETKRLVADADGNLMVNLAAGEEINIGTVILGTISAVNNLVKGTITKLEGGSVVLTAGTISSLPTINITAGTQNTLGTVGVLNGGSIVVTAGTVAAHAITNLAAGTLSILTNGTLSSSGTTTGVGVVGNVNGGSIIVTNGTVASCGTIPGIGVVASVTNLVSGTLASITNLADGTVHIDPKSPTTILTASALGTTAGTIVGTLSAASGAGTSHYVAGLQIVVHSGTTDAYIGFGTAYTGGSVLARGAFPPGGGIMRDFTFPIASGTNSEICYQLAGAGTALVAVNYWKA